LLHIYVDADACPVKAEVARVAGRHGLPVTYVANGYVNVPPQKDVRVQVVSGEFDAADDWIVERAAHGDIVITADIPLAARSLARGAAVVAPNGRPFTEDNIGDALATRELLADARAYGIRTGPAPFDRKDRSRFLQALEQAVQASLRRRGAR
jgi:uncharacterized protein YaiI (UPF0178 family)